MNVNVYLQLDELEFQVGSASGETQEELLAATAMVLRRIADEVESGAHLDVG